MTSWPRCRRTTLTALPNGPSRRNDFVLASRAQGLELLARTLNTPEGNLAEMVAPPPSGPPSM